MQRADVHLVRACCVLAVLTAGLVPSEGFGIRGTTCPYDMKHSIVLDVRTANEWNQGAWWTSSRFRVDGYARTCLGSLPRSCQVTWRVRRASTIEIRLSSQKCVRH